MLQNYIDLIKECIDTLTNLSPGGNTFWDYLRAVGYEFAILGLVALFFAIFAIILACPFIVSCKLYESIASAYKDFNKTHFYVYENNSSFPFYKLRCKCKYASEAREAALRLYDTFKHLKENKYQLFTRQDSFFMILEKHYETLLHMDPDVKNFDKNSFKEIMREINEKALEYNIYKQFDVLCNESLKKKETLGIYKFIIYASVFSLWLLLVIPLFFIFF